MIVIAKTEGSMRIRIVHFYHDKLKFYLPPQITGDTQKNISRQNNLNHSSKSCQYYTYLPRNFFRTK